MSYYTYIYPVGEFENTPIEELNSKIEKLEKEVNNIWLEITSICAAHIPFNELDNAREKSIKAIDAFYDKYSQLSYLCLHKDVMANEHFRSDDSTEPYKPELWWNHFRYNECPENGIEDNKESLEKIKNKLIILCCSSIYDVAADRAKSTDKAITFGDIMETITYALETELSCTREFIENCIHEMEFCKLCVKYWDTHEED